MEMTFDLKATLSRMKDIGYNPMPSRFHLQVPNAKGLIANCLEAYMGDKFQWLPVYDEIAEWLSDNRGRGLFCYGDKGLGKTMICYRCIPPIVYSCYNRIISCYESAQEMNEKLDDILNRKLVYIDDVGTEGLIVRYGEKRFAFPEIVDNAEKKGNMLIVTTNLSATEIKQKYGDRTFDRLKAITTQVKFTGNSFRK